MHPQPGPSYLVAGRYRLRSKIGAGGMGAVWLAHDQLLDREVAVKQVISTSTMSEAAATTARQRALREGRLAARLSHPHAIAMHDVAIDNDDPWLVMEYLPSQSVADVLKRSGTVDPAEAARIGAQVADALVDAHGAGIVHRDIKPANILIGTQGRSSGTVKITDFGIAHAADDVSLTQTGIMTGTPAYLAPEIARGADPDAAADVYSLGATLYTMVEGRPPFGNDENYMALLHKVALGQIDPPQRAGTFAEILYRLLEPVADRRPTMAQTRDLLANYAAGTYGSPETVLTSTVSLSSISNHAVTAPAQTARTSPASPPGASAGQPAFTTPGSAQFNPTQLSSTAGLGYASGQSAAAAAPMPAGTPMPGTMAYQSSGGYPATSGGYAPSGFYQPSAPLGTAANPGPGEKYSGSPTALALGIYAAFLLVTVAVVVALALTA